MTTTEIKPNTTETGLARFERVRELVREFPSERFHMLLPTTYVGSSPLFVPTPSVVTVNPDDPRDVYRKPGTGSDSEEVCFHADALNRIANAAGIDFDPTLKVHDHDLRRSPLVCRTTAAGWYIDSLGQRRMLAKGVTHDLRDESPRAKLYQGGKALEVARQFICEQSETRAMSRVIRAICNLRSSYKKSELVVLEQVDGKPRRSPKPFVAIRFRLDESDPDVKKALIEQATGQARRVFGDALELEAGETPKTDQLEDIHDGEFIEQPETRGGSSAPAGSPADGSERGGTTAEAAGSTPAPRSAPAEPEPVDEEEPAKLGVSAERAGVIRAHVESLRKGLRWGKEAREKRPEERQIGLAATVIAKAIAGEPKRLTSDQQKDIRRAVLEFCWGPFGEYAELDQDKVSVVIDWAKGYPAEVREAFAAIAATNGRIAPIHAALEGQQTLGGVA